MKDRIEINPCKCGQTVFIQDIDDFENKTKTYIIHCSKCGSGVKLRRKIGEISAKKAIIRIIQKWNEAQKQEE